MNQALGSLPIVIHIKTEAFPLFRVDASAVSYNVGTKDKSPAAFFGLQFIHRTHLLPFLHSACSGSAYCALSMARSYGCDEVHGEYIRANGTLIFDKLKKIHGLGATERLVLELASLLADCGRSVSQRNRLAIGFDMIRQSEIYGVTFRQRLLTAHVIKYDEFTAPALTDSDFAALTNKEKTVIAKLVAMFRLAKALDASGRQKLYNLRVKIEGDSVVINADAALGNVFLEEWTFKNCAVFFKMVFGLDVILRIRRNMPGVGK